MEQSSRKNSEIRNWNVKIIKMEWKDIQRNNPNCVQKFGSFEDQPAWLRLRKPLLKKLQVFQNDFLRTAEKVTRRDHIRIEDLHRNCNNFPTIVDTLTDVTVAYLVRKEGDLGFTKVRENIQDRNLNRIGWHKMLKFVLDN